MKMIDLLWVARELAYGSLGIGTSALINILAPTAVTSFARPEVKRELCRKYIQEFGLWSYCMTEAEAGSDLDSLGTLARRVDGGYLLNGEKTFITNGSISDHLVVYARLEDPPSRIRSLSAFYVAGDSHGVHRGEPLATMGLAGSNTASVRFHNVFVPEEHLLGEEGSGLEINTRCLQRSKTLIAGAAVGLSSRAFDLTVSYLARRVLYRRPLLRQPAIRHQIAQLWTEVEASWLLACSAGEAWDTGQASVKQVSMAKMFAAHTAVKCVGEFLELLGGRGYLCDFEMERLYRDAKVLEIYEGPTLIQQLLIAGELFEVSPRTAAVSPERT